MYISPEEKVYIGITIDERRRRACWFRSGSYSGFRVAAARKKYFYFSRLLFIGKSFFCEGEAIIYP